MAAMEQIPHRPVMAVLRHQLTGSSHHEWANFRALLAAGAPWLVVQHCMLGPPTIRAFGFQMKDMRRAGGYTTAATGAAVFVEKR